MDHPEQGKLQVAGEWHARTSPVYFCGTLDEGRYRCGRHWEQGEYYNGWVSTMVDGREGRDTDKTFTL